QQTACREYSAAICGVFRRLRRRITRFVSTFEARATQVCRIFPGRTVCRIFPGSRFASLVVPSRLPPPCIYNSCMSTRSADYREAIDHLPAGAILVLQDVPWEAYEQLLEDLSDRPAVRVTYDQGKVEIVSPLRN